MPQPQVIKDVRVFDGDFAADIRSVVEEVGTTSIANKGSFSLCIPGGSVVAALGGFNGDELDFSKVHVFFCNEKIPTFPCLEGALKETNKIGIPESQVYGVGEGSPAEVAAKYSELLATHPSIDNSRAVVRSMLAFAPLLDPHPYVATESSVRPSQRPCPTVCVCVCVCVRVLAAAVC